MRRSFIGYDRKRQAKTLLDPLLAMKEKIIVVQGCRPQNSFALLVADSNIS